MSDLDAKEASEHAEFISEELARDLETLRAEAQVLMNALAMFADQGNWYRQSSREHPGDCWEDVWITEKGASAPWEIARKCIDTLRPVTDDNATERD